MALDAVDYTSNVNFEKALARAAHAAMADGLTWRPLAAFPRIDGRSAEGPTYPSGGPQWYARDAFRRLRNAVLARRTY